MNENTVLLQSCKVENAIVKLNTYSRGILIGTLGYFFMQTVIQGNILFAGMSVVVGLGLEYVFEKHQELKG